MKMCCYDLEEVTDGRVVRAVSQCHEMYFYDDLDVMSSNSCRIKLGVCSTSV